MEISFDGDTAAVLGDDAPSVVCQRVKIPALWSAVIGFQDTGEGLFGDGVVPGDGIRLSCIAGAPVNVVRAPLPSVEVRAVINAE